MQIMTEQEREMIKTAPVLKPTVKLELVSRSNPNDIRAVIDTSARNYNFDETGLIDGAVSFDVNREVLRSLSLTVFDFSGTWIPGPGRSLWLDAMIKVYRGYVGTQWWPLGVFDVVDAEISSHGEVRISGADKATRANGRDQGGFKTLFSLEKGLNLRAAIKALAEYETWGETDLNLYTTDQVLPYTLEYGLTDYPWQKAVEIGNIPGDFRPLHYDRHGRLTWMPDPDPNLLAPCWDIWPGRDKPGTASPQEFSCYIEAVKQIDAHSMKNWIGVRGGSGKALPVFAYAADENANSPLSVQRIGPRIYWHNGGNPDPLITTVEEAQARADYELRRLKQWHERIPLRISELPTLEPWDVIRIRDTKIGLNDTYQVVSANIPLSAKGEMQLQGWRVRKVAA